MKTMEENIQSDEHQFVVDEVSTIIKESIETVIGGNAYNSVKVSSWTSQVVENVLGNLSKLNKAFKYIGLLSWLPSMISHRTRSTTQMRLACFIAVCRPQLWQVRLKQQQKYLNRARIV
ncbi:dynein light chain 90F isoform X1 [Oratosquilla oratoria]|uniref:dynein light chain 90F isoform X1 n=1 Tax=Oratosquilla oratoria TaxID=337810 RepID=UPI003F760224